MRRVGAYGEEDMEEKLDEEVEEEARQWCFAGGVTPVGWGEAGQDGLCGAGVDGAAGGVAVRVVGDFC